MQNMEIKAVDAVLTMSDIDGLIAELEAEFGDDKLIAMDFSTNTNGPCTVVKTCAC
jgi:hypothetical protein